LAVGDARGLGRVYEVRIFVPFSLEKVEVQKFVLIRQREELKRPSSRATVPLSSIKSLRIREK
jgi:hypothetical protein